MKMPTVTPTTYLGTAATWEKGRQLEQYGANTYKYNNEGIRIRKQTSTEIHEYILDGTNSVKEVVTDICNCPKYTNEYLYDLDGTVCGLKYNGTSYYFYKNLQGDVIAITDDAGAVVARYTYNAWGKCTIVSDASGVGIAIINPFRYRGYIYDFETGLYYLQSRYYNPNWGRFLNADGYVSTGTGLLGYNMYAYCNNNPVMLIDAEGSFPWLVVLLVSTVLLLNSCSSDSEARTRNVSVTPGNFETVEEAVENFGDTYFFKSIQEDREYAAIIHEEQKGDSTYYTYSVVSIGSRDRVTPYFPSGKNAVAVVHTHGDRAVDQDGESFSSKDINFSIRHDIPIYVFTPNKNLRRFDPQTNVEETISWDGGLSMTHKKLKRLVVTSLLVLLIATLVVCVVIVTKTLPKYKGEYDIRHYTDRINVGYKPDHKYEEIKNFYDAFEVAEDVMMARYQKNAVWRFDLGYQREVFFDPNTDTWLVYISPVGDVLDGGYSCIVSSDGIVISCWRD